MEGELFKIVFKGEIGLDFEEDEVKDNLQKLCRFDRPSIDRLFSGGSFVLMKNLDAEKAGRYRETLLKHGAFTEVVSMQPSAASRGQTAPQTPTPLRAAPAPEAFKCPACGHPQEKGGACVACGIFFAKYELAQKRKAEMPPVVETVIFSSPVEFSPGLAGAPATGADSSLWRHCALLIAGTALLQSYFFSLGLMVIGFIILGALSLFAALVKATHASQSLQEEIERHLSFEVEERGEGEREWFPVATCALVFLQLVLYYALVLPLGASTIANHLAFLPADPTFWSLPLSAFTALLLHEGGGQLWGSLIFLWAMGAVLERRLGRLRLVLLFLFTGVVAGVLGAGAHQLLLQSPMRALGSSGAIAGLFGIFLVCSAERRMVFPFPLVGAALLASPIRLSIRIEPFLLLVLFFYSNLSGGLQPQHGMSSAAVGHLVNVGGFLIGITLAKLLDLQNLGETGGGVERRAARPVAGAG